MFNWIMFIMLMISVWGGYSHFNKTKKEQTKATTNVHNLIKNGQPHVSDVNGNIQSDSVENNVQKNNLASPRTLEFSPSTLVSCDTQASNCEPKDHQNYNNPETITSCITYASNCLTQESITRSWKEEEVFRPAENTPSEMDYVEPEPAQIEEMERTEDPQVGTFNNNDSHNEEPQHPAIQTENPENNGFNDQNEDFNQDNQNQEDPNYNQEPPMDEFEPESEPFYESNYQKEKKPNRSPASYNFHRHDFNKNETDHEFSDEPTEPESF